MRRPWLTIILLGGLILAGCAEPISTRVICHNANCVEPTNPEGDDTLQSMGASLALVTDDHSPIDGMEIDTFWDGSREECVFAHDLEQEATATAVEAATALGGWLRTRSGLAVTRSGGPFVVFVELKGHVGLSKSDKHTPEQRDAHVACALDVYAILAEAATLAQHPVTVIFTSFDPLLLAELAAHPDMPRRDPDAQALVKLGALQGIPKPLDSQTQPLAEFPDVEMVLTHPQWLRSGAYEAIRSLSLEMGFWMFQATSESLDAIRRFHPDYVTTSEARFMDAWLGR